MRREKKPIGRWIGEALLIFLSVLGAFYFDNLRDERAAKSIYIRHLKDFKLDLQENQGKFNYELQKTYNEASGQGYIKGKIEFHTWLDSLMATKTRASADTLISIIDDGQVYGVTPWIFESPQYQKLNSEFYSFIKNDSLKFRIQMHHRNNESRVNVKNAINNYVREFEGLADQLDLTGGGNIANRNVLFSNVSINTMRRLGNYYSILRDMTQNAKTSDSLLIIQVDHELELWGAN